MRRGGPVFLNALGVGLLAGGPVADAEPLIELTGVEKTYSDFWGRARVRALEPLTLSLMPGEILALLGPNGAGKSTTIKLILGLLFPTRGIVRVFGGSPKTPRNRARLGYLPEETRLHPFLTPRETLDVFGRLHGLSRPERKRRTAQLITMVGLDRNAERPVGEFSKGMARRIGLAVALTHDPDLLILDEPTSGLDPLGTREIKDLIRTLGERGRSVLLSSHLLDDVEDVADRIAILYGGKLRQVGRTHELLARSGRLRFEVDAGDLEPAAAAASVRAALATEGPVDVSVPADRLESLFRRVVEEAEASQAHTAGAMRGGPVAEFLGGAGTEAVGGGRAEGQPALRPAAARGEGASASTAAAAGARARETVAASAASAPAATPVRVESLLGSEPAGANTRAGSVAAGAGATGTNTGGDAQAIAGGDSAAGNAGGETEGQAKASGQAASGASGLSPASASGRGESPKAAPRTPFSGELGEGAPVVESLRVAPAENSAAPGLGDDVLAALLPDRATNPDGTARGDASVNAPPPAREPSLHGDALMEVLGGAGSRAGSGASATASSPGAGSRAEPRLGGDVLSRLLTAPSESSAPAPTEIHLDRSGPLLPPLPADTRAGADATRARDTSAAASSVLERLTRPADRE